MKAFTFASLFAAAAALPASQGANNSNPDLYHFQLMSLRSTSPIHFGRVNAAHSNIYINLPNQEAGCHVDPNGPATFQLSKTDKTLWLFSTDNPRQELYVDRSGMGQGKLGYTTGVQPAPRNAEREGWEVDEAGNLSFAGSSLLACPSDIEGAWSVWVSAGVANPGGNKDCLGLSARTIEVKEPVSCLYSS